MIYVIIGNDLLDFKTAIYNSLSDGHSDPILLFMEDFSKNNEFIITKYEDDHHCTAESLVILDEITNGSNSRFIADNTIVKNNIIQPNILNKIKPGDTVYIIGCTFKLKDKNNINIIYALCTIADKVILIDNKKSSKSIIMRDFVTKDNNNISIDGIVDEEDSNINLFYRYINSVYNSDITTEAMDDKEETANKRTLLDILIEIFGVTFFISFAISILLSLAVGYKSLLANISFLIMAISFILTAILVFIDDLHRI